MADLPRQEQEYLQQVLEQLADKASAQRKQGYPDILAFIEKERNEVTQP
jgi:hypothetical protein